MATQSQDSSGSTGTRVGLTYDVVYEVVRREKIKAELQPLEPGFLDQLHSYIREKEQELLASPLDEAFGASSRDHVHVQLHNVRRLIKELYDRREKKIVAMAQNRSKMQQDLVDTSHLMPHERQLYKQLVDMLTHHRKEALYHVHTRSERSRYAPAPSEAFSSSQQSPSQTHAPPVHTRSVDVPAASEDVVPDSSSERSFEESSAPFADDSLDTTETTSPLIDEGQDVSLVSGASLPSPDSQEVSLRFLTEIPQFIGSNLESYGPFQENEVAVLPQDVASILVKQGSAVEVDAL